MAERTLIPPDHLGDGVYVKDIGHQLVLAVNHHTREVIWMEPYVVEAFIRYARRAGFIPPE